jgi:hypothetical protein
MEDVASFAGKQFGDLAHIFDDLDQPYWEPAEIEEPAKDAFTNENDPYEFKFRCHLEALNFRQKRIMELE